MFGLVAGRCVAACIALCGCAGALEALCTGVRFAWKLPCLSHVAISVVENVSHGWALGGKSCSKKYRSAAKECAMAPVSRGMTWVVTCESTSTQ